MTPSQQFVEDAKPQFTHDCDACTFLGRHHIVQTLVPVDLYVCNQGMLHLETLIARFGSDGPDYTSCHSNIDNSQSWFKEARERWKLKSS